jgi:hypothetical protein
VEIGNPVGKTLTQPEARRTPHYNWRLSLRITESMTLSGMSRPSQGGQVQSLADTVLRLARILDERDRQTDARINTLIGVVERYFSNGKK